MSNRFHNKFHNKNHHTYPDPNYPDGSFDPIASPDHPFQGDFVINGAISAAPLTSAYGAFFSTLSSTVTSSAGIIVEGNYIGVYCTVTPTTVATISDFSTATFAISADGHAVINGALSANSLFTDQLTFSDGTSLTSLTSVKQAATVSQRFMQTGFNFMRSMWIAPTACVVKAISVCFDGDVTYAQDALDSKYSLLEIVSGVSASPVTVGNLTIGVTTQGLSSITAFTPYTFTLISSAINLTPNSVISFKRTISGVPTLSANLIPDCTIVFEYV